MTIPWRNDMLSTNGNMPLHQCSCCTVIGPTKPLWATAPPLDLTELEEAFKKFRTTAEGFGWVPPVP